MILRADPAVSRAPVLWILLSVWSLVTLTSIFTPGIISFNQSRYINLGLMCAFTAVHGSRRYGWRGMAVYFLVAIVITNGFENMAIVTGFPFGQYHHSASMGPQLFYVPLIIGPIFDFDIDINFCLFENLSRRTATDSEDVCQTNHASFFFW